MYDLGFMKTNLTHGKRLPLPAADADSVARVVVRRLGRGSSRRYLPRWWAPIAMLVRWLPWSVYRRLKD
jgi:hypothetical protein